MAETGTLKRVMKAFDWQLHKKGMRLTVDVAVDADALTRVIAVLDR